MKTALPFYSVLLLSVLSLSLLSCNKNDDDSMPVQQGDSLVEINAIYPQNNWLEIRYNNVMNAAINLTIAFYLHDGSKKMVDFTIPAGYKSLQSFGLSASGEDVYLNVWDYHSYGGIDTTTGTGTASGPKIYWDSDVDSIRITKVSSPDSHYGFKVLTGNDEWDYYTPVDPKTVLSFISNEDTISYSDYDFVASTTWFHTTSSAYAFYFFDFRFNMFSSASVFPLTAGTVIPIPLMYYNSTAGGIRGSQPNGPEANTNGSTLQLTITRVDDKTYDGTFSGNIWSSRQADTLRFTNGIIKNALLPTKQP